MRFLRPLNRFVGMLHGLPRKFVTCQVIFFPVMHGGRTVRVGRKLVKLSRSLVRVIWHSQSCPEHELQPRISAFSKLTLCSQWLAGAIHLAG
jgi:hypothetical protein